MGRGQGRLIWTAVLVFAAGILTAHGLGLAATPTPGATAPPTVAPTSTKSATSAVSPTSTTPATSTATTASTATTTGQAPDSTTALSVREINRRVRPAIIQITNN